MKFKNRFFSVFILLLIFFCHKNGYSQTSVTINPDVEYKTLEGWGVYDLTNDIREIKEIKSKKIVFKKENLKAGVYCYKWKEKAIILSEGELTIN